MAENDETMSEEWIRSQEWIKGKIRLIGKAAKTGLILADDGTIHEFDENAATDFSQLFEDDRVIFSLAENEADARGVMKAQKVLPAA